MDEEDKEPTFFGEIILPGLFVIFINLHWILLGTLVWVLFF